MNQKKLISKAQKLRQKTFNSFIETGEAHLGGSFSMIEILITLYDIILKKNDKFILSKAHASFPLCILLKEKGLNPKLSTHLEIDGFSVFMRQPNKISIPRAINFIPVGSISQ